MDLSSLFLLSFIALLVITDPFGMIAVFLSLTDGDDSKWRHHQALKCGIKVFCMLIVFFAGGIWILKIFGFSVDAVDIGGGLIIGVMGWQFLYPKDKRKITPTEHHEGQVKKDVSFIPLTLPIIAGPGAISVVLSFASKIQEENGGWMEWIVIGCVILCVSIITWLCFRFSEYLLRVLGNGGLNSMTRIMGFILICIATQMIISGIVGVVDKHSSEHVTKSACVPIEYLMDEASIDQVIRAC
ncbi:MAG: MarC family NAAT transporter [Planctomycetota bacterium]|nr:MarC family NAAT transporter [Planctomycetota bacterium]